MVNTHYMVDGHPIHNKDPYNGYYKSLWTIGWLAPINGYKPWVLTIAHICWRTELGEFYGSYECLWGDITSVDGLKKKQRITGGSPSYIDWTIAWDPHDPNKDQLGLS